MIKENIENIFFFDIETVSQKKTYTEITPGMQKFWDKKSLSFRKEDQSAEDVYDRAGIYAEFGKIVCISIGFLRINTTQKFKVKSFYGHDEKLLLEGFAQLLNDNTKRVLCGHNIKEFDIPYVARRMLIHNIVLPKTLDIAGKKPWETQFLDTMLLWKFGDFKNYTSLSLLCEVFNIPSPKDDIDGSEVNTVYWEQNDIQRITQYCEKDVFATAQLFLKYQGKDIMEISTFHSDTFANQ